MVLPLDSLGTWRNASNDDGGLTEVIHDILEEHLKSFERDVVAARDALVLGSDCTLADARLVLEELLRQNKLTTIEDLAVPVVGQVYLASGNTGYFFGDGWEDASSHWEAEAEVHPDWERYLTDQGISAGNQHYHMADMLINDRKRFVEDAVDGIWETLGPNVWRNVIINRYRHYRSIWYDWMHMVCDGDAYTLMMANGGHAHVDRMFHRSHGWMRKIGVPLFLRIAKYFTNGYMAMYVWTRLTAEHAWLAMMQEVDAYLNRVTDFLANHEVIVRLATEPMDRSQWPVWIDETERQHANFHVAFGPIWPADMDEKWKIVRSERLYNANKNRRNDRLAVAELQRPERKRKAGSMSKA